ncbi:LysE family translocator [Nitrobacter sp. JJSN]|jgi:threonine/homoserine/homoserine lactone efflux protein|uniref:LysE family translocator n=1 Tax=Nitrobacter sp. JJSN TaxID=3453033 RepID=UPI003F764FBA
MGSVLTGPLAAFALTSLVIEMTPGPNMAYLAALSLSQGIRAGLAAVVGVALGLSVYGFVAALGLSAVIDKSPLLYEVLRWGGVVYLLWLAWEAWASEAETTPEKAGDPDARPALAFRRGLITNLLNPKAAVFYVAVLPDFIQLGKGSVAMQTLALSALYVGIATLVHLVIVLLASRLQNVVQTPDKRRTIRRVLAVALAAIAIWFAFSTAR